MREIKFRAWDKEYNFMIQPDDIAPWNHELITGDGKVMEIEERHSYAGTETNFNDISNNRILMQYTGLRVNGEQPLYEGDIVPTKISIHKGWKQGWIHLKRNAVVEYIESEMKFMFVVDVEGHGRQYVPFDKSIRQSYKIIGNIYENPELLEVES
jgi:uncharacterized phage protein (TIGR01671 family)